jgi:hypothetical protein
LSEEEAKHDKLVQCKKSDCTFNKRIYVGATDTMQNCCCRKSLIIRLDEDGRCTLTADCYKK